jgi:hypothetical protein
MALQHSKWAPLIIPFGLTPQTIPRIDNTSTANDVTYIIRGLKVVKQQVVSISTVSIVWVVLTDQPLNTSRMVTPSAHF